MSSARKIDRRTLEGVEVSSSELDFMTSADLLPELMDVLATGVGDIVSGTDNMEQPTAAKLAAMGRALGSIAGKLVGGKLSALLPRLLAGTSVTLPDDTGRMERVELVSAAKINRAFTGRKKLAIAVIKMALEVNFADYFFAFGLGAAPQAAQP